MCTCAQAQNPKNSLFSISPGLKSYVKGLFMVKIFFFVGFYIYNILLLTWKKDNFENLCPAYDMLAAGIIFFAPIRQDSMYVSVAFYPLSFLSKTLKNKSW